MPKRKKREEDGREGDQMVPLPVQSFLWRQTSPFIRPKLGKLCEASSMSFERVIVQNILHGLSPSLCEAIQNMSRWRLVQASFPHIMHCAAAVLDNRKGGIRNAKFSPTETKLLYSLHWIILDAAGECEDQDIEKKDFNQNKAPPYLHGLSSIQLFIYLFAPLVCSVKPYDFESLKLENGLRLWEPLWEHRCPDIPCFGMPVKSKRHLLKAQRPKKTDGAGDVYFGSKEKLRVNLDSKVREKVSNNVAANKQNAKGNGEKVSTVVKIETTNSSQSAEDAASESAILDADQPAVVDTTLIDVSIVDETQDKSSIYKMVDNNNDSQEKEEEQLDISVTDQETGETQSIDSAMKDAEAVSPNAAPVVHMSDVCETDSVHSVIIDVACKVCKTVLSPKSDQMSIACKCGQMYTSAEIQKIATAGSSPEISDDDTQDSPTQSTTGVIEVPEEKDILSATYFDIAVLRCLFGPNWNEDGVLWALKYVQTRLSSMHEEVSRENYTRERSKSLPIPQIEVTQYTPADNSDNQRPLSDSSYDLIKERRKKRMRVAELRHFFEAKSDTDETDDNVINIPQKKVTWSAKLGMKSRGRSKSLRDQSSSDTESDLQSDSDHYHTPLSRSPLGSLTEIREVAEPISPQASPMVMPRVPTNKVTGYRRESVTRAVSLNPKLLQKPIITVTAAASDLDLASKGKQARNGNPSMPNCFHEDESANLPRSLTDSNIAYATVEEQVTEAAGSVHYITADGHLNFTVVLKAVRSIASSRISGKICELLLNIINALLDLDAVEKKKDVKKNKEEGSKTDKKKTEESQLLSAHNLAMDVLIRIYKSLGCPNGCGNGYRGRNAAELRAKGQSCFSRLQRVNPPEFRRYLRDFVSRQPIQEVVDFLHSFLGFCADPSPFKYSPKGTSSSPAAVQKDGIKEGVARSGYATNFGQSIGGTGLKGSEGTLVANILKPLVTKFVVMFAELHAHENIALYTDVRQLVNYVKEIHGGTFRRVALSGLLDATERRPNKKSPPQLKTVKVISARRTASATSESGDELEKSKTDETIPAKARRSIFRKKNKKVSSPSPMSDSEMLEDNHRSGRRLSIRGASPGLSGSEDNENSSVRRKISKFQLAWKRSTKSDLDDASADEQSDTMQTGRETRSGSTTSTTPIRKTSRMSFKGVGQATLMILSTRRKFEEGLKSVGKRRFSKRLSVDEDGMRSSELGNSRTSSEVIILREKKIVNMYNVRSGMMRFGFLLECCNPGSIPDPELIAAVLDLEAPVLARACLLMECAHFVHRCSKGHWPAWMKLNLPSFHQTGPLHSRSPSSYRRNTLIQRAAGRMFHAWGDALGKRLEELFKKEQTEKYGFFNEIRDENKRRDLRIQDEEEDFVDEATVNKTGSDCPFALKMVACQVLLEITMFLRETYQYLPRSRSHKHEPWSGHSGHSRRLSSAITSPGHSERSVSTSSVFGDFPESPTDRRITFAPNSLGDRSDSLHSSATTISIADPDERRNEKGAGPRRSACGKNKLLRKRRGSGSHTHSASSSTATVSTSGQTSVKHRSFKLKKQEDGSMKRIGSLRPRKISSQSQSQSDEDHSGEHEGVTIHDTDGVESPEHTDDEDFENHLTWSKIVVQLANCSNFVCQHQYYCHPDCFERQRRSCKRLMSAVRKTYESSPEDFNKQKDSDEKNSVDGEPRNSLLRERFKRRNSTVASAFSSLNRRESTPILEKIRPNDINSSQLKQDSPDDKEETKEKTKPKEKVPIVRYIETQAKNLSQSLLAIITKGAPVLPEMCLQDIMPVAWELLLETDQELSAAAASLYILGSVKCPEFAHEMISKELQHEETNQRINAILRFNSLWKFRFQVWPRMEEGANLFFKVPPPSIDFTLPSPTIGIPNMTLVDPAWTPHFKMKLEEVTVCQEQTIAKTFVTATSTRRKQQQEIIKRALLDEDNRKREAREEFPLTTVPIIQQAAYEPALHHKTEDEEEVLQEEINMAARRVSVAPINRTSHVQNRMSWRADSLHTGCRSTHEGEDERVEHTHGHTMHLAHSFFPSCICAAVLPIINLLEDVDVTEEGIAVCEVAERVIWSCIVEDASLFFRHFLEKLTQKKRQDELILLLRKLVLHIRELPTQTAHILFNYVLGYIMFYVRSPCEGAQESIGKGMSLLWLIIPSVHGIFFKDLKQTLKKEQCDPTVMVTANVPSAKKLIVHGPDLASIPSQFPVHEVASRWSSMYAWDNKCRHETFTSSVKGEDTQFSSILEDSLEFFNIPEEDHDKYFLADTKTRQMHNLHYFVRDFYFFRRNFYPQLSLVHADSSLAFGALQKQAFILKIVELNKVLFTTSVMEYTPHHQLENHVLFVHEELLKQPTFPRKALEAEFGMYHGELGKELHSLDTIHKYAWTKFMSTMFRSLPDSFAWTGDIPLFLNVISGALLLHCEDSSILRCCLATFINISRHFKHVFAFDGFLHIMPTILKVYNTYQANPLICSTIEFACQQFYILHRKPFILQMFGSVASVLNMTCKHNTNKVQPEVLFQLLLTLETECKDSLDILDLVEGEKPLTAIDFCYTNEADKFVLLDAINMCVTVVAYASDSVRSAQMLTILDAIMPFYLKHINKSQVKRDANMALRQESLDIHYLAVSMRALISSCDALTRNMSAPIMRHLEVGKKTQNQSNRPAYVYDDKEESVTSIKYREIEEGRRGPANVQELEEKQMRHEYRKPRDHLLCVAAEFYTKCNARVKELRKKLGDSCVRASDLLDGKCHEKLADVAHTLLKVAVYDPSTMTCRGLQRYMLEMLPVTDWSQELNKPALNLVLRRLERLFTKVTKKIALKRGLIWEAAANLLKGIYMTLHKHPFIAHLTHLRTLINVCISAILTESGNPQNVGDSGHNIHVFHRDKEHVPVIQFSVPQIFCSAVVKLVAMQMLCLGDLFSLEHICAGSPIFSSQERTQNMMMNFILPLCIRVGCGRKDSPRIRQADISFALSILLNALLPSNKVPHSASAGSKVHQTPMSDSGASTTIQQDKIWGISTMRELVIRTAFLGLKIMITLFEKELAKEWPRIAKTIMELGEKMSGSMPFWKFIEFVVSRRTALLVMLHPYIKHKLLKRPSENEYEFVMHHSVQQKINGVSLPMSKSRGSILVELHQDLGNIREETCIQAGDSMRPRLATNATERSDVSQHLSSLDLELEQLSDQPLPSTVRKFNKPNVTEDAGSLFSSPAGRLSRDSSSRAGSRRSFNWVRSSTKRITAQEGSQILRRFENQVSLDNSDGVLETTQPIAPDLLFPALASSAQRCLVSSVQPTLGRKLSFSVGDILVTVDPVHSSEDPNSLSGPARRTLFRDKRAFSLHSVIVEEPGFEAENSSSSENEVEPGAYTASDTLSRRNRLHRQHALVRRTSRTTRFNDDNNNIGQANSRLLTPQDTNVYLSTANSSPSSFTTGRLHRRGAFYRSMSKQSSIDVSSDSILSLSSNEVDTAQTCMTHGSVSLLTKKAIKQSISTSQESYDGKVPSIQVTKHTSSSEEAFSYDSDDEMSPLVKSYGINKNHSDPKFTYENEEASSHRLQRQDAKSRKTFKFRRDVSKKLGTIRTPAAPGRAGSVIDEASSPMVSPEKPEFTDSSWNDTELSTEGASPVPRLPAPPSPLKKRPLLEWQNSQSIPDLSPTHHKFAEVLNGTTGSASNIQIEEIVGKPIHRFRARSKSNDSMGTRSQGCPGKIARGRITRQGGRRSRSPSQSPHGSSLSLQSDKSEDKNGIADIKDVEEQAVRRISTVSHCSDTSESSTGEASALLKSDQKSGSDLSLTIYFDENARDTIV